MSSMMMRHEDVPRVPICTREKPQLRDMRHKKYGRSFVVCISAHDKRTVPGIVRTLPLFLGTCFRVFTPCSWDLVVVTSAAVSSRDVQCLHRWKRRRARTATVLQRATRIEIVRVGFQEPDLVKHTRTKIRIRLLLYEKATCKHLLRVKRAESDSDDGTTTQCHNAMMDAPSLGLYA